MPVGNYLAVATTWWLMCSWYITSWTDEILFFSILSYQMWYICTGIHGVVRGCSRSLLVMLTIH